MSDHDCECIDFGFWLVNSPVKNKYSKRWIEIKYQQYLKEKGLGE